MQEIKHGMKQNTIKLVLRKKLEDWFETIKDVAIREQVKQNTIVTGGCISSMLLGEKINDYDIYFKSIEVTENIARYYCNVFNNTVKPASQVSRPITPKVKRETKKNIKGEEEERIGIWIQSAGVVAESQNPYAYFESQIETATDAFAESLSLERTAETSIEGLEVLSNELKPNKKDKYRPVYMSQNAITLSDKVQLVIRFYGDPEQIHKNFDYVHATCWYDYGKNELVLPPEALESMLSRSLVYRGSLYPLASIFRIRKFIERGWRITAGQLLKIMWQVSELDFNDREVLNEQLLGVDRAYMWQLISELKNVEGKIDSTYIVKIIDNIFE